MVLKRYLPSSLVDAIVRGEQTLSFEPSTQPLTVLFADLCGFTSNTQSLLATHMAELLNEYLVCMTRVVFAHGGTVDKFIGDSVMVVFGAPEPMTGQDQARRAVACALEMQVVMAELNARWEQQGLPAMQMRVGVHHGPCVVGNFGGDERMEYTAIGSTVNIASRIEGVCPPGAVLVSREVGDYLPGGSVKLAGDFELEGVRQAVTLFALLPAAADAPERVA